MPMPLVSAHDVCKVYDSTNERVVAVDHVSFQVEQGERVALLGASGSGKTTLLNLLSGLDQPTSGEIHVGDHRLSEYNERQRALYRATEIGVIFQAFHLLPNRTAVENVELPLIVKGVPANERRPRAEAALDRVGLANRLHHRPNALSGGEQQRVAIARAVVHQPRLLLADEPTGNLDSQNTQQILEVMLALTSESQTALIVITHDEQLAQRCATRIVRMADGCLVNDSSDTEGKT